jgi:hypothetical protein
MEEIVSQCPYPLMLLRPVLSLHWLLHINTIDHSSELPSFKFHLTALYCTELSLTELHFTEKKTSSLNNWLTSFPYKLTNPITHWHTNAMTDSLALHLFFYRNVISKEVSTIFLGTSAFLLLDLFHEHFRCHKRQTQVNDMNPLCPTSITLF